MCFVFYFVYSSDMLFVVLFFFFKQKTAYEMRISDWSSDVCSSDLPPGESGCAANSSTALVAAAAPTGSHPEFIGHDRSSGLGAGRLTSLQDVGQQGQKTRTLDRTRHLALLLGGHGGDPARHDLAALGHEARQQLGVLVVDGRGAGARERARLATAHEGAAHRRPGNLQLAHGSISLLFALTVARTKIGRAHV